MDPDFYDKPIKELLDEGRISLRAYHACMDADLITVRGVREAEDYRILRIPNCGRRTLRELRELCGKVGT